ncbi:YafY family protein [Brevundimonas sp.]|uniref:helix-turn-helix transcriptional regulator n=1 Tax=Brevundimonas sp. TaxID=1871086 RepID=UPI0026128986|nr:YafY family protein [Brevundimonas sp.]
MRASRILSILILMQMRGRISADALAREFEVSVRTIYRDMDHLSAAGVPVYAERGRAGGFALLDGYRTRLTGLTVAESDALVLAGAGTVAADLGLGDALATAQLKLLASLPPDSGASADRVARRFHLDPIDWYRRTEAADALPGLAGAVWGDRRVRVRYESWTGEVHRVLDPLGLVLKGGTWYLVAAVEGQARTYRVSNIHELEVLDAAAVRPRNFVLATYWAGWSRDFEARLLRDRARIRLSPEGFRQLRAFSPAAAEAAVDVAGDANPAGSGWRTVDLPIESIDAAAGWLLHLGPEAEAMSPPALRGAVAKAARAVLDLYDPRQAAG